MSLRFRLALIISLLLLLSLAATLTLAINTAREQVAGEVASTAELTSELLSLVLAEPEVSPRRVDEVMRHITALRDIRHLDVEVVSYQAGQTRLAQPVDAAIAAPAWFIRLVQPAQDLLRSEVLSLGGERVLIRTIPDDEIAEAWARTRETLWIAFTRLLLINAILFLLISYWLKPLDGFTASLDAIERGDFSRRIPTMHLSELQHLAERMNSLAAVLGAAKLDNERLARRSLHIQEQERRHLAQELHDSMGQSISAIKAMAVTIRQRAGEGDAVVSESARKIEEISNGIYSSVRGMMSRLRPSVLDELGLTAALRQMTDDWNGHHEEAFCRLRIEGEFDGLQEDQQINVYRIVQEALTNIARHSQADSVDVALSGREVISLMISDNGVGYDLERVEQGMGLSGIRERVQVLHGELSINTRPRQGVSIQIEFPRVNKKRGRRATDARTSR